MGSFKRSITKEEKKLSKIMRRGVYVADKIKSGQKFNDKNLILQRPETKLKANFFLKLINKKSKINLDINCELDKNNIL